MNNQWMNMSVLALSLSAITTALYAEEQPQVQADQQEQVQAADSTENSAQETQKSDDNTSSAENGVNQAATALQKKDGDATGETNLQEVFTSNERQYSLIKKGVISSYYDIDYTYYRDSQIDAALNENGLSRFRIEEDANHTLTNSFTVQYGVLDNLTLSATLPFIAKKTY